MTTKVTNIYNLKLTPSQFGQNSIVVNCSQYDSLFRVIQFNLFNGNAVYSIPEGSVVTIRGTKKDNTGFEYECDYSNNVVTFPLQQQITIFPGKVPSELRITKEGEIIGSWNFLFLIEESPLSDDTTISETQLPLLEQAIEAAGRLNEAFDDIAEFTDETYPNAVQTIQNEGATQVSNVTNEGTTQRGLVSSEGATQIANVQAEGATQVANVQAKGTEVLDSIPSDYTELSGEVSHLSQNIDSMRKAFPTSTNLFNIDDPDVMNGEYITNTGQQATSQSGVLSESGWIAVEPSTQYMIGADGLTYPRYITEYDSSKTVISGGGASEANITTTPSTAYIRFCFRNNYNHWRMNKGSSILPYEPFYYDYIKTDDTLTDEYLPANAKAVGDTFANAGFSNQTYTADDVLALTFTDGYVGTNGGVSTSTALHYSNQIDVSEGDTLYTGTGGNFRFVCAYDSNGSAVSAKGADSVSTYTVPSGIVKVVVTTYKSYTGTIRHTHTDSEFVASNGQLGYFRAEGNLSDGDTLTLPITNVNKNVRQAFTADITSFSGLLIGRKNGNEGYWAVIDGTNITVYRDNVASDPVPHGLTIQNNIQVRIITHNDLSVPNDLYNADIIVTSNGESFTAQNIGWVRTYNTPIVQSIGSTLTDCVMSWETGDADKAIYMFGDSYFSWYPQRWTYYCAKDGFANNALFNAYAGENTANAVIALQNVVPMGRPKYLVWCLGMNDGSDSESAPSSAWVTGIDAVINICKRYGITPIFATIPTVPTINNEQKNAWVRNSGYRYIDFAKAVGADSSGNWYSGMIESDNVHPSEKGAKALYGRVLTDFPEIMVNN